MKGKTIYTEHMICLAFLKRYVFFIRMSDTIYTCWLTALTLQDKNELGKRKIMRYENKGAFCNQETSLTQ